MITVLKILEGDKANRTSGAAKRREPMTAANARHIVAELERHTKSAKARAGLIRTALKIGNISDEARAIYTAYAATFA
jgi:hypothetical protein